MAAEKQEYVWSDLQDRALALSYGDLRCPKLTTLPEDYILFSNFSNNLRRKSQKIFELTVECAIV